ncbi:unnamed protein product [Alternaria burnsii]|nr:unnamed protein product [Alternaria burnsii]
MVIPHHSLTGLVSEAEQDRICPIRYLHNPLQSNPSWIRRCPISFPRGGGEVHNTKERVFNTLSPLNGICDVPYCSSIADVYETRFWKEGLEAGRTTIYLLASEKDAEHLPVKDGHSIQDIARRELRPGFKHRVLRCPGYMYPFTTDARRFELIAIFACLLFLFDDRSEVVGDKEVPMLIDDFCKRLEDPKYTSKLAKTPLQAFLDQVTLDVRAADAQKGNGGEDMYRELLNHSLQSIKHPEKFTSLDEYLRFRDGNICAGWTFAAVKFSLASSINMKDPAIAHFMKLATEHLSIANDIYSYEKEARAYHTGQCPDLINFVTIVQQLLSCPDEATALEMSYALLLQREQWILEELKRLESENLSEEMWDFLRGMWANLSGNTFFSMTTVRYGGEKSRIPKDMSVSVQVKASECGCALSGKAASDSGYSDDASDGVSKIETPKGFSRVGAPNGINAVLAK